MACQNFTCCFLILLLNVNFLSLRPYYQNLTILLSVIGVRLECNLVRTFDFIIISEDGENAC